MLPLFLTVEYSWHLGMQTLTLLHCVLTVTIIILLSCVRYDSVRFLRSITVCMVTLQTYLSFFRHRRTRITSSCPSSTNHFFQFVLTWSFNSSSHLRASIQPSCISILAVQYKASGIQTDHK